MRGHLHSHNNTGSKGSRSCALLVLLTFGAAIFGVMTLHKLRDRRTCNHLVKKKDSELNTLRLLLQKEKEHGKEARRQIENTKNDIHWLHTQKTDLDSRILEMKSTISSLKEEERRIEVALVEKQGEIKMLMEKHMETKSDDSQVTLLSETLRQKEAEIEDLKHRLEVLLPARLWSVSADDPSNLPINSTTEAAGRRDDGRRRSEELHDSIKTDEKKIDSSANESAHNRNKEFTGQGEYTGKDGKRIEDAKSKTGEEQSRQQKTSQNDVPGQRENADNREESYLVEKRYSNDNASKEIEDDKNQAQEQSNGVEVTDKGVMKLEMQEHSKSRGTSKDYIRKRRGKRRQTIAKHQVDPESHGTASMRNRKFLKENTKAERIGGTKLEIKDHQKDKGMDVDMRNKEDHGIEMNNKIQQAKDSEEQINDQIRSEQGVRSDTGRHRTQDVSTNYEDSPPGKTWTNPNNIADHGTEMTNEIQQGKDWEVQINNQIRPEQGRKSDTGRHRMQDVITQNEDSPPGEIWPNPNNFAAAEEKGPRLTQKLSPSLHQWANQYKERKELMSIF